jgi:hypothetical protein
MSKEELYTFHMNHPSLKLKECEDYLGIKKIEKTEQPQEQTQFKRTVITSQMIDNEIKKFISVFEKSNIDNNIKSI